MKRLTKQTTPLSSVWQFRIFGYDFVWGYIKIKEATEIARYGGEDAVNDVMARKSGDAHHPINFTPNVVDDEKSS